MLEVRTKGMTEGGDEKESEREMRGRHGEEVGVRERRHEWGECDAASGSVASRAKLGRERREEKKKV
jgi:hypothetical protein